MENIPGCGLTKTKALCCQTIHVRGQMSLRGCQGEVPCKHRVIRKLKFRDLPEVSQDVWESGVPFLGLCLTDGVSLGQPPSHCRRAGIFREAGPPGSHLDKLPKKQAAPGKRKCPRSRSEPSLSGTEEARGNCPPLNTCDAPQVHLLPLTQLTVETRATGCGGNRYGHKPRIPTALPTMT